ncbi:MAG: hypothetical protein WAT12_09265 [Candidatus Nitrotoga sp.]
MTEPVLKDITSAPNAGRHELYRWCDYIEIRCLSHVDKRFSRDALVESLSESADITSDEPEEDIESENEDDEEEIEAVSDSAMVNDKNEQHSDSCFRHLRWRASAFGEHWPFTLDEHTREISIKPGLTDIHKFYISLLLSSSLSYVPKNRWRGLTGLFEEASTEILRRLMPRGAEVRPFGAANTTHYTGHLFDRLTKLAQDVRGTLDLKKEHFAPHDSGDSGLDIVAWHGLGDERKCIPAAFAQCGCTASGWPDKMLQASPSHLGAHLKTTHQWETYYFMPLDLSTEIDGKMDWQMLSDFSSAIVIDRLRFIRLTASYTIPPTPITAAAYVSEAMALDLT